MEGVEIYNMNSIGNPFCYEADMEMFNHRQLLLPMVLVLPKVKGNVSAPRCLSV